MDGDAWTEMPDRDPAAAGLPEDFHLTHTLDIPGHGTPRGETGLRDARPVGDLRGDAPPALLPRTRASGAAT